MKYIVMLILGIYFGHLMTKAGIEPGSSLYWQFLLAQVLLMVGGAVICLG